MQRITSRQNALVSRYRSVARGDDPSLLLLDGVHLVGEGMAAGLRLTHMMVAASALDDVEVRALAERAEGEHVGVSAAAAPVMAAVSPVRSTSPIVAIAERPVLLSGVFETPVPLVLVACDVQDPGNLGAIVRVAEAASASGLVTAGASADPFGWKALRGSMGSALRLPIAVQASPEQAVASARRHGCRVVATVPRGGRSLFSCDLTGPLAILLGGEGPGLDAGLIDAADERVSISMQPPVESLNAAVAAALVLYEARRQRQPD